MARCFPMLPIAALIAALAACGQSGSGDASLPADGTMLPAGLAEIRGRLAYPSEELPPMRVCAVDVADTARAYCVETSAGSARYRIQVPPGTWWLMAWAREGGEDGLPGTYSEATECLTENRSGCDDHRLRAVDVEAGDRREGVDILDWYGSPADWGWDAEDSSPA